MEDLLRKCRSLSRTEQIDTIKELEPVLITDIATCFTEFLDKLTCLPDDDKDFLWTCLEKNSSKPEKLANHLLLFLKHVKDDDLLLDLVKVLDVCSCTESLKHIKQVLRLDAMQHVNSENTSEHIIETCSEDSSNQLNLDDADYHRVFRSGDDDEDEITYSPEILTIRKALNKLTVGVKGHLEAFINNHKTLTDADKEVILNCAVKRSDGHERAVRDAVDLLIIANDNFFEDIIQALEACSLNEISSILQNELIKTREEKLKYDKEMEEYSKTNDTKGLLRLAAQNRGQQGLFRREIKPRSLVPRKYQEELASVAKQGYNCLICAPTNSGKTFVSTMIVKNHCDSAISGTAKKCVLFLVPRFALLQQVYEEYKIHLPLLKVGKKSGQSPSRISLQVLLNVNDVVIVTATILENALKDGSVTFGTFSLLIFDECHHAYKDHAYNKIMEMYIRTKPTNKNLPQVVGLTASPGAGQDISATMAQEWILKVCANLDSRYFVTVEDNLSELQKYTNLPKRSTEHRPERDANPFDIAVREYMKMIERHFDRAVPVQPTEQEYLNHVTTLRDEFIRTNRRDCRLYCDHLCEVHEALNLAREVRLTDGYALLKQIHSRLTEQRDMMLTSEVSLQADFERLLEEVANYETWEQQYPNPSLELVKKTILENKRECDNDKATIKEFRAMVYAKTRQITLALCNWMSTDPELSALNPQHLTGVHASVDEGGMTSLDTKRTLADFDKGIVKVLICTTVGEEGINIPACRLVIRYRHVTNEISMIQARGRIREKEGNEVVIGNYKVMEKDKTNVLLEYVMQLAIKEIRTMSAEEFRARIEELQSEALLKAEERDLREVTISNLTKTADSGSVLHCKKCDVVACPLSEIRCVYQCNYINPNRSFTEKVKFVDHSEPKKRQLGIQKIFCKACDQDWGNTATNYPCLKISSFVLVKDGIRTIRSKWTKVQYSVPSLGR